MAGNGLITGRVWTQNGRTADGATVRATRLTGDLAPWRLLPEPDFPSAKTDSSGRFGLPFQWMGSDFASGIQNIEMQLCASIDVQTATSRSTSYESRGFVRTRTRAYMVLNATRAGGIALPDLQSCPGLLQYALDLKWAFNKFRANLPMVNFDHAESFLLLGALDITLTSALM